MKNLPGLKNSVNSVMILLFIFFSNFVFSQGLFNNGANIVIESGAYMYIDGDVNGNFRNETSGSDGEIENSGIIRLDGDWINNANNGVFITNDGTVEFIGGAQSIGGTDSTYFNNLTLGGTGTKTLNINTWSGGGFASPSGVLSISDRVLDLNSNKLTITNPLTGAITYSTGYIKSETSNENGKVQWNIRTSTGNHVFPFGNASAVSIPFSFNVTAAGTESGTGNVILSTYNTIADNTPYPSGVTNVNGFDDGLDNSENVVDRFWRISVLGYSTNPTADITFKYDDAELDIIAEDDLQAQRWDGSIWTYPPVGSVNTGANTVTVSGVQTFSPWALVNKNDPLPIELLNFNANCNNNQVALSWSTASETNNYYFTVEKSLDGIYFEEIAQINGAGNSSTIQHYMFIDNELPPATATATIYYRLKQTDYNGIFSYYDIVAVNCYNSDDNLFIYTSPESENILISLNGYEGETYDIYFIDQLGRTIIQKQIAVSGPDEKILISKSNLAIGIYNVVLRSANNVVCKRIVII